ncbi:LAMI_0D07140g1_1 [Lachancea mirantina]|uniref:LAMI_0D07140g1_1 n=1 Tax=Lachancea mirantina TaxID=1230905 RepID=A0A1G4JCU2_9SACH|nr:LAMI_0D07140g1_1 [Lachancea mirantina]
MNSNVPSIPGFYFDPQRRRYFRITANSADISQERYKKETLSRQITVEKVQDRIARNREIGHFRYELIERHLSDSIARCFDYERITHQTLNQIRLVADFEQLYDSIRALDHYQYEIPKSYQIKRDIWSDLRPFSLGRMETTARIIRAERTGRYIVITKQGTLIKVLENGDFIVLKEDFDFSDPMEVIHIEENRCRDELLICKRSKNTSRLSFEVANLSGDNIQAFQPSRNVVGDLNCATCHRGSVLCASNGLLQLVKDDGSTKTVEKPKSDILCIEISNFVGLPDQIPGWFCCRNGSFYQLTIQELTPKLKEFKSRRLCHFKERVISIIEAGSEQILLSMIGTSHQTIGLIEKRLITGKIMRGPSTPHDLILQRFESRFHNLTRETEIFSVDCSGRYFIYGDKRANDGRGDFDLFSTNYEDNLLHAQFAFPKAIIYERIKAMSDCFPADELKDIKKIVSVCLVSGRNSEITRCHNGQLPFKADIVLFTEDKSSPGFTQRTISI